MKFRTNIKIKPTDAKRIDYNSTIMAMGSCFVENIGSKLTYYKFKTLQNPFGIIFNPVSIENLVRRSVEMLEYSEDEVFYFNDQWHCSDVHSQFDTIEKSKLIGDLNERIAKTHNYLKTSSHIIITLGTAWVYRDINLNKIVANCHKRPQSEFSKDLLSVKDVGTALTTMVSSLQSINPNVQIIFTVSPVRHIKDGLVENNLSKSLLIAAMHENIKHDGSIRYFPSYEIVMDDLRDYRFYESDMIHPNNTAIDYIWEHFVKSWVSKDSYRIMMDVESIQKSLNHRPFNPSSERNFKFLEQIEVLKRDLRSKFSHIEF